MERDPRWEDVSAAITPNECGRRIDIEIRLARRSISQTLVMAPFEEPFIRQILDLLVDELDRELPVL